MAEQPRMRSETVADVIDQRGAGIYTVLQPDAAYFEQFGCEQGFELVVGDGAAFSPQVGHALPGGDTLNAVAVQYNKLVARRYKQFGYTGGARNTTVLAQEYNTDDVIAVIRDVETGEVQGGARLLLQRVFDSERADTLYTAKLCNWDSVMRNTERLLRSLRSDPGFMMHLRTLSAEQHGAIQEALDRVFGLSERGSTVDLSKYVDPADPGLTNKTLKALRYLMLGDRASGLIGLVDLLRAGKIIEPFRDHSGALLPGMELSRFVISETMPMTAKLASEYFLLRELSQAFKDSTGLTTAFSSCSIQFTPRLIEHAALANQALFGSDAQVFLFPSGDIATGDACGNDSIPNYHRGKITLIVFATSEAHLPPTP